jgi:hypothetical protein
MDSLIANQIKGSMETINSKVLPCVERDPCPFYVATSTWSFKVLASRSRVTVTCLLELANK